MKRILSLVLAVTLMSAIIFVPTAANAETYDTYEDLTYKNYGDHIEITGCNSSAISVDIPAEIDGLPVTSIGIYAFGWCSSLTDITIPDSVTSIGHGVFYDCKSLTEIIIPDNVTSIGLMAFYDCESLTEITIPDSVTSIGIEAFYDTAYYNNKDNWSQGVLYIGNHLICADSNQIPSNYSIRTGTKCIADFAFSDCTGLTEITIPNSVTSIGEGAFEKCYGLTNITIPDSVTSIGDGAFSDCYSLTDIIVDGNNEYYSSINSNLFNKDQTEFIQYAIGKPESSYTIPVGVTSIGDAAFKDCESLTDITIPIGVTSIGDAAFKDCESLTNITIPDSVAFIGDEAFYYCYNLAKITIPDGVTSIGDYAFGYCFSLTEITIPDSVTSIGDYAFNRCDSLTNITIPDSVTYIGVYAFYDCESLTEITIPDSVTSIREGAFSDCYRLSEITIPDSVTSIGDWAFSDCTSLTDVYYGGSKVQWDNIDIDSTNTYLTNVNIHFNSAGPGGGGSNSGKAPIIKSAKLTYGGETYDILTQAVTVEENSNVSATIEASVDDNGCKNVHVYVTQGAGTEVDITGICRDIKPGKDFSANKDIYILAIDEDTGRSTSKRTKLKVSSLADGKLGGQSGVEGLNFKLGGDTGFTIPDSVPVFGGTEIKWEFDFIPISVEYDREDNNKINVVFGTNITKTKDGEREYFSDFNFKKYKEGIKKAASKQNRTLKQLRNDFKMSNDIKMSMFGGNMLGGGSGEKGSSVDVAGYAELHVTENGLQFTEGQLCVNVEFTYNYQGQIFIWVIPLYYEFGGGAGAGFEGDMKNVNPISFSPEFEAYITGKIMGSIGGGIGIAKVATAGAAGEAALNLKKSLQNSYFKADVDGSANFNVKIFGKEVAKKVFASGNFLIYETGNSKGLLNKIKAADAEADNMFGFDVNAIYENEPRGYIKSPTLWLGSESVANAAAEYSNKNLKRLAENIYTECAPQICETGGKKIMIMQWDDPSRSDADRTMLVYSVYNESSDTWSEPTSVDDDGTADFYPCFRDGYLVWQNEKTTLSDNMTLTDIAKLGEICVSKWNGNGFDKPAKITDNSSLDTQPQIAVSGEGASVVWTTNTDDDIMGTTGSNAIIRSDFDGAAWSVPREIRSGLNAITNITAGSVNGDFCAAYVTDDDNDLNTIDDRDIRIIGSAGETQLTHNDVLDSNPVLANNMIYYYSGGNIAYSKIDGTGAQTVFTDAKAGLTDSFTVSGNDNGDAAIWWTKAESGGAEVYSTLLKDGAWSDEIRVTNIGNTAKYPSGVLNGDGTMLVAFNNGILENNEIVKTDLYTVSVVPSYDLEISDAYIDEDTMTVYATVKNSGELNIDSYAITIDDGGVNSEKTMTQPLKAGESADISIDYNKPQNFSKRSVKLTASIQSGDEYYTENNSKDLVIGNADISVDNVSINTDETLITADISNIGYDKAENVKISLCDGDSVIDERNLTLSAGDSSHVEFSIDKSSMKFFEPTKPIYIKAEFDDEEASLGNNDGYVLISSPSGAADHEAEILSYAKTNGGYVINTNAANNTESAVSCNMYAAVYAADGSLKACGTVPADIEANSDIGVDIPVSCEIETGDTIKTFMWSDSLEPLAEPAKLDM